MKIRLNCGENGRPHQERTYDFNDTGIGISFGETALLENVTQGIEDYDRIGVLGINGTGKSTLLAIVAGALEPDEGHIIMRNGLKISYLPQNPVFDPDLNILENVVRNISQEQEFWNVRGEAASMLQKLGIPDPAILLSCRIRCPEGRGRERRSRQRCSRRVTFSFLMSRPTIWITR